MDNRIRILDLLYNNVIDEGGDGDAIWFSRYSSLEEILKLINEYNLNNNTGWCIEEKENYLLWGDNQEWVTITCDKEIFDKEPSWTALRIIC